ncbi:MAG TPA: glutathione transferase GstA [Solimonas sp.]|nr:glutathione transferase GstA [Solimonas sp.]
MKLYFSPGACSLASHITLHELGLPAQVVKVDTKQKRTADGGDFLAINAKGYVPALALDDGSVLTEGPAILQYLADRKPEAGLAPANGTMARYRLQEWLGYLNSEVHKGFVPYFMPDSSDADKQAAGERLGKKFDWMQQQLGDGAHLAGENFTVADAYCYTLLSWTGYVGIDLARWPGLKAYRDRVGARPSVQAAHAAEKAAA